MKDSIALLISATGMAAVAWAFWYFLGDAGFNAIVILALIALTADNFRLRRQLRGKQHK